MTSTHAGREISTALISPSMVLMGSSLLVHEVGTTESEVSAIEGVSPSGSNSASVYPGSIILYTDKGYSSVSTAAITVLLQVTQSNSQTLFCAGVILAMG